MFYARDLRHENDGLLVEACAIHLELVSGAASASRLVTEACGESNAKASLLVVEMLVVCL